MFDFWGINHSFLLSSKVLESMALLFYLKETPLKRGLHPSSLLEEKELIKTSWPANLFANVWLPPCPQHRVFLVRACVVFRIQLRVLFYQDGTVIRAGGPRAGNLTAPVNTMITSCPHAGRRHCS